jgi:hypothetical protein
VKTGAPGRWMANDLPPWEIVYQQSRRWLSAGCFEALAEDLRVILRLSAGRPAQPTAASIDSRSLRLKAAHAQPMMEPNERMATPANADDRAEVGKIAQAIQAETDESVEIAFVDQAYAGEKPATAAAESPSKSSNCRSLNAASFFCPDGGSSSDPLHGPPRFRRLVKDYERFAQTLADLHLVCLRMHMLKNAAKLAAGS